MTKRFCHKCRYFATVDEGYSNYTVEETMVHCLKGANKFFPIRESYSWEREDFEPDEVVALAAAVGCPHYGEPFPSGQIRLDVDGEVNLRDWPELIEEARAYFGEDGERWDRERS